MSRSLTLALIIFTVVFHAACPATGMSSYSLTDTVVAGMDPKFRPFSFKTADKKIAGFDVDYLSYLAGRAGIKLRIVEVPYDDLLASVSGDRIQIAFVGMSDINLENSRLTLSQEYYIIPDAAVTNLKNKQIETIKDLSGRTVSVLSDTMEERFLPSIVSCNILSSRKATVVLDKVLTGKADVAFLDWGLSRDLLRYDQNYIGKLKIAFEVRIPCKGMVMAIAKDNVDLLRIINEGIEELSGNGIMEMLEKKWFRNEPDGLPDSFVTGSLQ